MPDLESHLGRWSGTWRTYLRPDELFDESAITATVSQDGNGYVIEYHGQIGGDDVTGSMRAQESDGMTTVDWLDSWHTSGELQRLQATAGEPPSYRYGDDEPWTWDIAIETSPGRITVAHHNSGPGIPRYLGVVMEFDTRI